MFSLYGSELGIGLNFLWSGLAKYKSVNPICQSKPAAKRWYRQSFKSFYSGATGSKEHLHTLPQLNHRFQVFQGGFTGTCFTTLLLVQFTFSYFIPFPPFPQALLRCNVPCESQSDHLNRVVTVYIYSIFIFDENLRWVVKTVLTSQRWFLIGSALFNRFMNETMTHRKHYLMTVILVFRIMILLYIYVMAVVC